MEYKKLGEINEYVGKSINPLKVSEEVFEMYSVPSFDTKYPEIVQGKEIGSSKQLVKKNDILLCKINPRINRVWTVSQFTDKKLIASSEWIVIRNKEMCSRYLAWYFRSEYFRTLMISNVTGMGGSLMRAQPKQVQEYLVPIVNYDNQVKIADILDKAQELIDKRKEQIERLDELVKSKFIEMFGHLLREENRDNLRTLNELIDKSYITYHLDGNHGGLYPKTTEFVNEGVPYIGANCINKGSISFENAKYLTEERAGKLRKGIAQNKDVLFAHNATVGPVAILKTNLSKVILSTSLTAYRCNYEYILPEYLKCFMESQYFIKQYSSDMSQTTRNQVPITVQRKYNFVIPKIEEQIQFADFVNQVDKLKVEMENSLKELEDNFNSLMQKAFKGELF